jgi:hypothetical protein
MFDKIKKRGLEVPALHHAEAILLNFTIPASELVFGGGRRGRRNPALAQRPEQLGLTSP